MKRTMLYPFLLLVLILTAIVALPVTAVATIQPTASSFNEACLTSSPPTTTTMAAVQADFDYTTGANSQIEENGAEIKVKASDAAKSAKNVATGDRSDFKIEIVDNPFIGVVDIATRAALTGGSNKLI